MPEKNAVPIPPDLSVDVLQDSIQSIKIEDNNYDGGEGGGGGGGRDRDPNSNHRPSGGSATSTVVEQDCHGAPNCIYYLTHGVCGYGSNCRYNHPCRVGQDQFLQGELPERDGQPDCQMQSKRRSNLDPERLSKLVFIKYNKSLHERFQTRRVQNKSEDYDPIVLDDLNYSSEWMTGRPGACNEFVYEEDGLTWAEHFLRTGNCKYGRTCKYNHPKSMLDEDVSFNMFGLPMRQEEKSCSYYMRTGYCKYGIACKFDHPQPSGTPEDRFYVSGSGYAHFGPSIVSPSGLPLIGATPAWSPRPCMSNPQINGFPLYMPSVFLPSQGLTPGQHSWNTYTGTISPHTSTDTVHPGQVSSSNYLHFGSSTEVHFPQRPGQPDCQYYMKNGSCKYGSTCKYHHPIDRITLSTACTIGPLGLPLRPGQAVCMFYTTYGTCKYGLHCKYDHPFMGYYNYAVPSVSISDPTVLLTHQRSSPVLWTPPDAGSSKTSELRCGVTRSEATAITVESTSSGLSEEAPPLSSSTPITASATPQDLSD